MDSRAPDHLARMVFLSRLHTLFNYTVWVCGILMAGTAALHLLGEIPFPLVKTTVTTGACVIAALLLIVATAYNDWFLWILTGGSILFPTGLVFAFAAGEALMAACLALNSVIAVWWTGSELQVMARSIGKSWFDSATLRWAQNLLRSRASNTEER